MSDTLVVVNEHAGGGQMADTFRRMEHALREAVGSFDLAFTDGVGDATRLVRQALEAGDCRQIIVGGGDGTLNEAVNGFFGDDGQPRGKGVRLGLLAGGTGGDFRKTLGIKTGDDAIAAIRGGKTRTIDVGLLHAKSLTDTSPLRRYFVNIASFGLSGHTDRYIPEFKKWGGKLGYFGATLKGLWTWKNLRVRLTIDGEAQPPQRIATVAVANGKYFGGGMMVAPDARLDSGHFAVTTLGDMGKLEIMLLSRSIYAGEHIYHPKVRTRTANVVEAVAEPEDDGSLPEVYLDIDGEAIGALPARFEIVPGAIDVITP